MRGVVTRYVAAFSQGADKNGIVFALAGQTQIVGETRGDP